MTIQLNGEIHQFAAPLSLAELVERHAAAALHVAVAQNREVVPRAQWPQTYLKDGDEIEIFHAVGGG